jgi:hypothetical protein
MVAKNGKKNRDRPDESGRRLRISINLTARNGRNRQCRACARSEVAEGHFPKNNLCFRGVEKGRGGPAGDDFADPHDARRRVAPGVGGEKDFIVVAAG